MGLEVMSEQIFAGIDLAQIRPIGEHGQPPDPYEGIVFAFRHPDLPPEADRAN
jgi:hypothetical protein